MEYFFYLFREILFLKTNKTVKIMRFCFVDIKVCYSVRRKVGAIIHHGGGYLTQQGIKEKRSENVWKKEDNNKPCTFPLFSLLLRHQIELSVFWCIIDSLPPSFKSKKKEEGRRTSKAQKEKKRIKKKGKHVKFRWEKKREELRAYIPCPFRAPPMFPDMEWETRRRQPTIPGVCL